MTKNKGLGRGLDALLSGGSAGSREDQEHRLAVELLQPGKYQPRSRMNAAALEELAASIRAQGVIQPVLVRPIPNGRFEIIAGERRWRAAQIAGLAAIPVVIREIPDEAALAMALIENIQREGLNPVEEAVGLQRLVDEFGMTHQQAADAVGRSRPAASNLLRLLQLAIPVQEMLLEDQLSMGHARSLLPLQGADQVALAKQVVANGLSVRQLELLVRRKLAAPSSAKHSGSGVSGDVLRIQERLSDTLGADVRILAGKHGSGRLVVAYGSLEQLDGILRRIDEGFNDV
jgi:ParB family chromosome partitioning protein